MGRGWDPLRNSSPWDKKMFNRCRIRDNGAKERKNVRVIIVREGLRRVFVESFTYESIFGPMCVRMKNGRVYGIELGESCYGAELNPEVFRQLEEYFRGTRKQLDFPVEVRATEFQLRVWQALRGIPYGSTISYGELAKKLGTSPRALGQALKRNPLPLYFPCHRVVGKDSLGGFSSGLEWKKNLLALESGERCAGSS